MSNGFSETTKIALFGANSTGKTLQIRSLIETFGHENVGIVSCEDGLKTIQSSIKPEQVMECNSIRDLKQAFEWATGRYVGKEKWVCVDGGTRALQWIAGEIWAGTDAAFTLTATDVPRGEWPKGVRPFLRYITDKGAIDGQRQWIDIGRAIDFELNRWVKLPCNMYWTFWEDQTNRGQYDKGLPWQTDAPGKGGRDAIYGSFDFIMRLTRDGEKFTATYDPLNRVARSKARDDWAGGIKVISEQADFSLAKFAQTLKPHMAATEAK